MKFQDYFKSQAFKITLYVIGGLFILLLVFQAGILVGFRKANFSFGWGENYHRNFGGPRRGLMGDMRGDDFINGHGVTGTVIKIDNQSIVMKDIAGIERIVNTNNQTSIKNGRTDIVLKDLKTDDRIVVLGTPEADGSIAAKMIRVLNSNDAQPMPFPPMMRGGQLPAPTNSPQANQPITNQVK